MTPIGRAQILCVDDEVEVLHALAINLGRHYHVLTATGGAAAVAMLVQNPEVGVIISDMRMLGMSGAEFLARARVLAPQAQRILLTGQTDLASAIVAVNEGQIFRFLTKPCAPPQLLGAVQAAMEQRTLVGLERSAIRQKLEDEQLQVDSLTGLASRHRLMAILEAAAFEPTEAAGVRAAFCVEIDAADEPSQLRELPWEDELAKIVAERLVRFCTGSAVIARSGIGQFVVIEAGPMKTGRELRERGEEIAAALRAPIRVDGENLTVGVSVGIAQLEDPVQWRRLVSRAVEAVREARRTEDMRVCVFQGDAPRPSETQRELRHGLRAALDREELHLHYQPIVDVDAGRVRSIECLARWRHRTLGDIAPTTFIALAEQSGDIVRLGEWVLWRACHEAPPSFSDIRQCLAVNVSARQLLDANFRPHLQKCLAHSGLAPEMLELEITESALMAELPRARAVLDEIRKLGVRVAADDFGTGYSSLAYLSQLPIDVIKVDRIFVQDFDRGGKSIITAALNIARDFDRQVIVEGVESAEMLL